MFRKHTKSHHRLYGIVSKITKSHHSVGVSLEKIMKNEGSTFVGKHVGIWEGEVVGT